MVPQLDRNRMEILPLSERVNKLDLATTLVNEEDFPVHLTPQAQEDVARAAAEIRRARAKNASVMLAFGAHSIKNGLASVLIALLREGWITHFATNGAGMIHDWEFAFQGQTGEDVQKYVAQGQFGIWEETGAYLNLAIATGAWQGWGYGESIGRMIAANGLEIPTRETLLADVAQGAAPNATEEEREKCAAASDLLLVLERQKIPSGFLPVAHPCLETSLAYQAVRAGVPFTCHPMIGHDIIYTHPCNHGAAIGRAAQRDFLTYAQSVAGLEGGVYLSVGSAVMSPMIFEKSLSMARNMARQSGKKIADFSIHVVDLATSSWDWASGSEPPMDDPAYYLRFCKTFHRMGGRMTYCGADNRSWLVALLKLLGN
ncbi:MAG: hypothetical protein Q4D98_00885 [Planctomycetia bacterium]|nr:hypothetical protein [Planctomycetia bacterium]